MAQIMVDLDWDEDGNPLGTNTISLPDSISFNGNSYPAEGDPEEGVITYTIKDDGDWDNRILVEVSSIEGGALGGEGVQIYAIAPNGNKFSEYSANFSYYKEIPRDEADSSNVGQAIDEAVASLQDVMKMRKSVNTSFTDMVAKQRNKNRGIQKGDWQTDGISAIEGLKSPEEIANEIWGDLTNLIARACDDASYGVDTPTEISGGLASDYYSKVAEALIPMLQEFIGNEKWR